MEIITKGVEAFERIVNLVSTRPVASIFVLNLFFASGAAYVALNHADRIVGLIRPTPETEAERFHESLEMGGRVSGMMAEAGERLRADRVLIAEFHNNVMSISGVPWMFTSVRYAHLAPGIAVDLPKLTGIPNSMLTDLLRKMWSDPLQPSCFAGSREDIPSSYARSLMRDQGTRTIVLCPMQRNGIPLGLVIASWLRSENGAPIEDSVGVLKGYADEIGGVLASAHVNYRSPGSR